MSKPAPVDPGLQQIADWQRWLVAANVQRMKDDGYDDAAITRERVGLETLAANIAARMTSDYLANRGRSPHP